jgi:epoxyqueuosine reductase
MANLEKNIKNFAKTLGFDLVEILPASSLDENQKTSFQDWINSDFAGEMEYMKKETEKRIDLLKKFPDAKTIIILGMNYFPVKSLHRNGSTGKIAKYAYGRDYHKVIEGKLKKLKEFILNHSIFHIPHSTFKLYVDYGPILERAYAVKAGFGFIGRNTCLITEKFGSWVFLAELVTNLGLCHIVESTPCIDSTMAIPNLSCGNCAQCLSACPTGALISPYKLDARKCISYLTIENKGSIPEKLRPLIVDWLYGCDLCQEVCPHNARAKATKEADFKKQILGDTQILKDVLSIRTDQEFKQKFAGSPVIRIKRKGLLRNACVVAGNLKDKSLLPILKECLKDEEELVREHAEWAITEIENVFLRLSFLRKQES